MSSMLEQAIIDAAALREAALKNAEQSLIEKYAPQIKEAVQAMLEDEVPSKKMKYEGRFVNVIHEAEDGMVTVSENGGKPFVVNESELSEATDDELLQEEEMEMATGGATDASADDVITAPFAGNPTSDDNQPVELNLTIQDMEDNFEIDLGKLEKEIENELGGAPFPEEDTTSIADMGDELADLDLGGLGGEEEGDDTPEETDDAGEALLELLDILEGNGILEEEIEVDMSEQKDGTFQSFEPLLDWYEEMQEAADEHSSDEEEEENKEVTEEGGELYETIDLLKSQNEQLETVVYKLNDKLEETLLSNAKLLYQNRVLADASLNERQKDKIVEAISKAESPKEARHLCETLRTTVGSSKSNGPKSLNETVNRKSNLSGIINRRQNLNESKNSDDSFVKKMQKLAGIK